MIIRTGVPGEAAALSRLARAAKAHWGYPAAQLDRWRDDLTVSAEAIVRRPTFVAEIDGAVAGFVQLDDGAAPWSLEHCWVDPRCMRRGVGRALLAHALAAAAAAGETEVAMDADPFAEPFYLAVGARRVGEIAAPIAGHPARVRPQLRLAVAARR